MEFSENLQIALSLRKEGNPEALKYLEKACAEGDGYALFFKAKGYETGGFFLEKNWRLVESCYEASAKAGCPWSFAKVATYYINGSADRKHWIEKALASSDDYVSYLLFDGLETYVSSEKALQGLKRAAKENNVFAQYSLHFWLKDKQKQMSCLEKSAEYGDAEAQYSFGIELGDIGDHKTACSWFLKGAKQKHWYCYRRVAEYCLRGYCHFKNNIVYSAVFFMLFGEPLLIRYRLESQITKDSIIRLQELFIYGKGLRRYPSLVQRIGPDVCAQSIRIYDQSTDAARKAALCFMWLSKGIKGLYPDVRRMIAKMVYDSRADPSNWEISL
jgi:TPR repeat protein